MSRWVDPDANNARQSLCEVKFPQLLLRNIVQYLEPPAEQPSPALDVAIESARALGRMMKDPCEHFDANFLSPSLGKLVNALVYYPDEKTETTDFETQRSRLPLMHALTNLLARVAANDKVPCICVVLCSTFN